MYKRQAGGRQAGQVGEQFVGLAAAQSASAATVAADVEYEPCTHGPCDVVDIGPGPDGEAGNDVDPGPVSYTHLLALAGFLAGYSGLTRDAYALDLRQFLAWCTGHGTHLFAARRADIECFGRDLEAKGRARSTVSRRLCTVAGFYRYAVEEELLDHSPAVHVRRPRVDYESHATALDRNEVGALLVAAGLGPAPEHALIFLLALNGLRVSEATGANIEALGLELSLIHI